MEYVLDDDEGSAVLLLFVLVLCETCCYVGVRVLCVRLSFLLSCVHELGRSDANGELSLALRALENKCLSFGISCLVEGDVVVAFRAS